MRLPIPRCTLLLAATILAFIPSTIMAQTFCVHTQDEMRQALYISSANGEDDLIRIVQGAELEDLRIPSETGFLLRMEGGYAPGCGERRLAPAAPAEPEITPDQGETPPAPQQSTTGPTPPPGVEPKTEFLSGAALSGGSDVTVVGVPPYAWRHGCGPTAVGMVVGYWDGKGCDALFDGSAATQTSSVQQGIASQGSTLVPRHYEDYSMPLDDTTPTILADRSTTPAGDEHVSDSIADFMHTSWSSDENRYGWSYSNYITPAFTNYVQLRKSGYSPLTTRYYYTTYSPALTWSVLTAEITAGRPMVFLVDTDGNGGTDHFVTVVGYRLDGSTQYYGCYDTWDPVATIRWERFRGLASGNSWGIWGGYSFSLTCPSTPPVTGGFSWTMFLPAVTSLPNPLWGATNQVCCSGGPYTFSLSSGGVTKRSTIQYCTDEDSWEGWVEVSPGPRTFSWSTYGSCTGYYGTFNYTLSKGKAYSFYAKWTGTTIEIWVTTYTRSSTTEGNEGGGALGDGETLREERIEVIPLPQKSTSSLPLPENRR